MNDELQQRVQRGMTLLDKEYPGWREKINLAYLDLSSGCDCVLGQVYGHYIEGSHEIGLVMTDEEEPYTPEEAAALDSHGFNSPSCSCEELTEAWKQALGGQRGR